jgi:ATP-dependent helicase/nuclease subunit B
MPTAEQRRVEVSVTGLDRLRGDPYQFYAGSILRLRRLDAIDAEPSAALRGELAHAILNRWHLTGEQSGALASIAGDELDRISAHPLLRALWRPRLMSALAWIEQEVAEANGHGRRVAASEIAGAMHVGGIRVHGRADRIDRLADGTLAIVDYKTGAPPSGSRVQQGFALQLGLIGLIARSGGFDGIAGEPRCFEYWSFAKKQGNDTLGYRSEPILEGRRKTGLTRDEFLAVTWGFLTDAIDRWILGDAPFTARLNPDLSDYNDFDQLMRLDEWIARLGEREREHIA